MSCSQGSLHRKGRSDVPPLVAYVEAASRRLFSIVYVTRTELASRESFTGLCSTWKKSGETPLLREVEVASHRLFFIHLVSRAKLTPARGRTPHVLRTNSEPYRARSTTNHLVFKDLARDMLLVEAEAQLTERSFVFRDR